MLKSNMAHQGLIGKRGRAASCAICGKVLELGPHHICRSEILTNFVVDYTALPGLSVDVPRPDEDWVSPLIRDQAVVFLMIVPDGRPQSHVIASRTSLKLPETELGIYATSQIEKDQSIGVYTGVIETAEDNREDGGDLLAISSYLTLPNGSERYVIRSVKILINLCYFDSDFRSNKMYSSYIQVIDSDQICSQS